MPDYLWHSYVGAARTVTGSFDITGTVTVTTDALATPTLIGASQDGGGVFPSLTDPEFYSPNDDVSCTARITNALVETQEAAFVVLVDIEPVESTFPTMLLTKWKADSTSPYTAHLQSVEDAVPRLPVTVSASFQRKCRVNIGGTPSDQWLNYNLGQTPGFESPFNVTEWSKRSPSGLLYRTGEVRYKWMVSGAAFLTPTNIGVDASGFGVMVPRVLLAQDQATVVYDIPVTGTNGVNQSGTGGSGTSSITPPSGTIEEYYNEVRLVLSCPDWNAAHNLDYLFQGQSQPTGSSPGEELEILWWDGGDRSEAGLVSQGAYTGERRVSVNYTVYLIPVANSWADRPYDGGGGGETPDAYSLYGLSADTHPFGVTRMVYNVGFNSNALTLRRYYGQMGTPSDVALPFTGQSPHILCRDDGRHLVAASDGTNISVRLLDDEGTVLSTMPSPGSGKLVSVYQSRADAVSPVWAAFCTADTGTGDIKVYRTFDPAGLTGWEAAVTVASGMPAQKPTLTGDMARLLVSYHDGSGNVQTKYSTDNGATWTLSS